MIFMFLMCHGVVRGDDGRKQNHSWRPRVQESDHRGRSDLYEYIMVEYGSFDKGNIIYETMVSGDLV